MNTTLEATKQGKASKFRHLRSWTKRGTKRAYTKPEVQRENIVIELTDEDVAWHNGLAKASAVQMLK